MRSISHSLGAMAASNNAPVSACHYLPGDPDFAEWMTGFGAAINLGPSECRLWLSGGIFQAVAMEQAVSRSQELRLPIPIFDADGALLAVVGTEFESLLDRGRDAYYGALVTAHQTA